MSYATLRGTFATAALSTSYALGIHCIAGHPQEAVKNHAHSRTGYEKTDNAGDGVDANSR
jgi:hypothetical protein